MNNLIKYLLNFFDPETAHKLAVSILSRNHFVSYRTKDLYTKIANLEFKNPIGLAAGFDKSGQCIHGIFKLGFSSVEVGTVTPFSQAGNNKPRVFRLYKNRAVINSYGFNNDGMEIVKNRLNDGKKREGVLGVNIGPNKKSKNPIEDFKVTSKNLSKYCDYITINISSPNTPGLRNMHDKNLLSEVIKATKEGISEVGSHKPIFLKISKIKKFFRAKYYWYMPKEFELLIYDEVGSESFKEYLDPKYFYVLDTRIEKLNLFIFLKSIIKKKVHLLPLIRKIQIHQHEYHRRPPA